MRDSMATRTVWLMVAGTLSACGGGETDTRSAVEDFEQRLLISVEGGSIPIPLEAMDVWLTDEPAGRESFEIHGDGVSIAGVFPRDLRVDYAENWHVLVGKVVPLSSQGGNPAFAKPSVVNVPGVGQYRVTGGSITVEKVEPGRNGETPLTGRIELRVRAASGEISLIGTFAVKAMTWG